MVGVGVGVWVYRGGDLTGCFQRKESLFWEHLLFDDQGGVWLKVIFICFCFFFLRLIFSHSFSN